MHKKFVKYLEKKLGKHNKEKKLNKRIGFVHHINHQLIHMEELLVVCIIGSLSIMLANSTGLSGPEHAAMNADISINLEGAIDSIRPGYEASRIISQWRVDSEVKNTFYPGYCTYGAALISPEFFPYISEDQQARTRGGNAAQWCENAKVAGYQIGNTPQKGSLIVYAKGDKYVNAGHVGKVLYYNKQYGKMIVRDMNRVGLYMMSDRREYDDNDNVKCYIYPSKVPKETTVKPTDENIYKPLPIEEIKKIDPDINLSIDTGTVIIETGTAIIETGNNIHMSPEPKAVTINAVDVDMNDISIELEHFLSQWDVEISTDTQLPLRVGEERQVTIAISSKDDFNKKYSGVLPKAFSLIATTTKVKTDYSFVQLVSRGEANIKVIAQEVGESILIINRGDKRIAKINISVE